MLRSVEWRCRLIFFNSVNKSAIEHVFNFFNVGVISKYFDVVKKMGFEDAPDYDLLRKILKEDLIKHK